MKRPSMSNLIAKYGIYVAAVFGIVKLVLIFWIVRHIVTHHITITFLP